MLSRPIRTWGEGLCLGVRKVHAGFLEETDWGLALEGWVGVNVDSRWSLVLLLAQSTCVKYGYLGDG